MRWAGCLVQPQRSAQTLHPRVALEAAAGLLAQSDWLRMAQSHVAPAECLLLGSPPRQSCCPATSKAMLLRVTNTFPDIADAPVLKTPSITCKCDAPARGAGRSLQRQRNRR